MAGTTAPSDRCKMFLCAEARLSLTFQAAHVDQDTDRGVESDPYSDSCAMLPFAVAFKQLVGSIFIPCTLMYNFLLLINCDAFTALCLFLELDKWIQTAEFSSGKDSYWTPVVVPPLWLLDSPAQVSPPNLGWQFQFPPASLKRSCHCPH